MSDLGAFLLARIDDDEATARLADQTLREFRLGRLLTGPAGDLASFFTHEEFPFHPARVLAQGDARRRIVEWCDDREMIWVGTMTDDPDKPKPEHFVSGGLRNKEGHVMLQMLALPYADHPDYREEWKP